MNAGIGNVKSKIESGELLTTTTAPTESGGVITISTSDISGTPKENNYLAYIDSDNITALYKITNISSGTATLSLIGNVGGGGGSQLYQHNISVYQNDNNNKAYIRAKFTIINDNNTPLNTLALLSQYFIDKFGNTENDYTKGIAASGIAGQGNPQSIIFGVCLGDVYNDVRRVSFAYHGINGAFYISYISINNVWNNYGITDTVITL